MQITIHTALLWRRSSCISPDNSWKTQPERFHSYLLPQPPHDSTHLSIHHPSVRRFRSSAVYIFIATIIHTRYNQAASPLPGIGNAHTSHSMPVTREAGVGVGSAPEEGSCSLMCLVGGDSSWICGFLAWGRKGTRQDER